MVRLNGMISMVICSSSSHRGTTITTTGSVSSRIIKCIVCMHKGSANSASRRISSSMVIVLCNC